MTSITSTFANQILNDACQKNASDIHFYPKDNKEKVTIHYRIHGIRQFQRKINKVVYQSLLTYFKFSSNMDIGEIRKPQNGVLSFKNKHSKKFSLRLSTLPLSNTESLTIRILPQEETPLLEQLFLFPKQFKKMKSWMNHQSGIILLTGPTGCGKTTTMYALLESMLQKNSFQAITLEDPIERSLDNVLQVEVNEKAGITYQTGLKAALRHDPDVLLIGEIRDAETAKFALRASLTGHLVLTTLHAKDALGTIDRLIELGIDRLDLCQSLIAVASLKLLPIEKAGKVYRRAAIVELLDGEHLFNTIKGDGNGMHHYHSFDYLKEKALLYGFISEEIFYKI